MEQQLCQHVNNQPDAIVIRDPDISNTYYQLIARANILTRKLQRKAIRNEDLVCIFLGHGLKWVVA